MIPRLAAVATLVIALLGLIVYSKLRPEPNKVSGFIEADEIRVGSRIGGRVAAVHAREGERVREGMVLVELEPFDLLARERQAAQQLAASEAEYQRMASGLRVEEIAQARARRDRLQAQLQLLEHGPRDQEIEAARGRVRAAVSEQQLARRTFERYSELVQTDAISREDFDRANERLEAADALLFVRGKELELLEAGTREEEIRAARGALEEADQAYQMSLAGFRAEDVAAAAASRDAARAALEVIQRQKDELIVKSPVDGTVDSLDLQPGDMVAAGAPILTIIDDRHSWVRAYVPRNQVGLREGQQLRVTVDSYPGRDFLGRVSFISPQAEFTPSNVQTPEERTKQVYRVKVTLEVVPERVSPGLTADVWLNPIGEP